MKRESACQQAPVRNESIVGAQVYSHSGEFSPRIVDLALPGRGVSFQFVRKYRSALCQEPGLLGHGWTITYAKRIEREDRDILYHDGSGRLFRFASATGKNGYVAPDGLYAVLTAQGGKALLRQRYGAVLVFEDPEAGGRLLAIEDRNGNALKFKHKKDAINVIDSFGRQITISLDQNRIVQLRDHADRVWQYRYSEVGCLVEVILPATDEFPKGTCIRYDYDEAFRLTLITDPNGQTFLRNSYDDQGRVVQQKHGNGTFEFQYEAIGQAETGYPIYRSQIRQKNGARLTLLHNSGGQVVERTLFVSANSLSPEDRSGLEAEIISLTTKSKFNRHGELIERIYPAGDMLQWRYDQNHEDPRARGNLLQVIRKPSAGVESDQDQITTRYTYEPKHQRCQSITDPRGHTTNFKYDKRGNLTQRIYPKVTVQNVQTDKVGKHPTSVKQLVERFECNAGGQQIRFTDARGAVTEYHYYPANDPTGAKGQKGIHSDAKRAGGYLARIVRDPARKDLRLKSKPAHLVMNFGYDVFGNVAVIRDGKDNPTRFQYDTHKRLVYMTSREPFKHQVAIRYDANGNPVEAATSFDHYAYDPIKGRVVRKSSTICRRSEFNILNNIVAQTIVADGQEIVEIFVRDASENITRRIRPMGNVTEYRFDERNLLLEKRMGVGTKEETAIHHTYSPNGRRRSTTDGRGGVTRYQYDGFHRYRGFTNAEGVTLKRSLDEAGNIMRIEITGDAGLVNERGEVTEAKTTSLVEVSYRYDELNRSVRVDRAWRDLATGKALGASRFDGEEGMVATVVEYDDNHHPSKVFYETGNILSLEYDGANRLATIRDATGESVTVEYDENSNPMRIERLGPEQDDGEKRVHDVIIQRFDELDRLVARAINLEPPERFDYNAPGLVTAYTNPAEVETKFLHDAFGRWIGSAIMVIAPRLEKDRPKKQELVNRVKRDLNGRIIAWINAAGHCTQYQYDVLNRRTAVISPDGAIRRRERDSNGNVVRIVDPNRNVIIQRFDLLNRLLERRIEPPNGGDPQIETFRYDGLNRNVAALTAGASVVRCYDSLSRLLEEAQGGRVTRCRYDTAGNCTHLIYPSGQEVHKVYDLLNRVSEVRDSRDGLVAKYTYRASDQLKRLRIGNVLETMFAYAQCQNCLREIIYRSVKDGKIIEGSRYLYDVAGNRTQEAQLHRGNDFGERYFYDSANRLVGVHYGVERLSNPNSQFEQEVHYHLSPVGTWRHKTTRDAEGHRVARLNGITDRREAYISLGRRHFDYDANGNRIWETNAEDWKSPRKRYSYDYANRLIRVECLDAQGKGVETIEYIYDGLSRQVLKRIADGQGTREYTRVWSGPELLEEYEDGNLSKSFIHGARVNQPVKMKHSLPGGIEKLLYTFNGQGLVTGLVDLQGKILERFRYDAFGEPFLSELAGEPVGPQDSSSPVGNLFVTGGSIWDHEARTFFGSGNAYEPTSGQYLNAEVASGEPGAVASSLILAAASPIIDPGSGIRPGDPVIIRPPEPRPPPPDEPITAPVAPPPDAPDADRDLLAPGSVPYNPSDPNDPMHIPSDVQQKLDELRRRMREPIDTEYPSDPPTPSPPPPPDTEYPDDPPPLLPPEPPDPDYPDDPPRGEEGGPGGGTVEAMPGSDIVVGPGPRTGVGARRRAGAVPGLWAIARRLGGVIDPVDPLYDSGRVVSGERRRGPVIVDPLPDRTAAGRIGGPGGFNVLSVAALRLGGVIDPIDPLLEPYGPEYVGEGRRSPVQPGEGFPGSGGSACRTGDCSLF